MDDYSKGLLGIHTGSHASHLGLMERMRSAEENRQKVDRYVAPPADPHIAPVPRLEIDWSKVDFDAADADAEQGFATLTFFSLMTCWVYYPVFNHGWFGAAAAFGQDLIQRHNSVQGTYLVVYCAEMYVLSWLTAVAAGVAAMRYCKLFTRPVRIALLLSAAAFTLSLGLTILC